MGTREEARAIREEERAAGRAAEEHYRVLCDEVDAGLRSGLHYRYIPGQKWGRLCAREATSTQPAHFIAALPALRRAGVCDPCPALHLAEERWGAWGAETLWVGLAPDLTDPGKQDPRVTLRALSARVRRLPASQRAQVAA